MSIAPKALDTPNNIGDKARMRRILATKIRSSRLKPGATNTLTDSAKTKSKTAAATMVIIEAEITELA